MKAGDRVVLTALPHVWKDITAKSVRGTLMSGVHTGRGGGVSYDNPTTGATRMTPEGVKVQWDGYEYAPGDYHWVSPEIVHVIDVVDDEKPEVTIDVEYRIETFRGGKWHNATARSTEELARAKLAEFREVAPEREYRLSRFTIVSAEKSEVLE